MERVMMNRDARDCLSATAMRPRDGAVANPRATVSPGPSRGFTLAEVLASLTLMAVIIPVALEGVSIVNRVGTVADRKAGAARIAKRILNEFVVTGQIGSESGQAREGSNTYDWRVQTSNWEMDAMNLVTVEVTFDVQGKSYDVSMGTLYDPTLTQTDPDATSVQFE